MLLENEQATLNFGQQLASQLKAGDILFLRGDLGAGKTTLTRGILQGLGVTGPITSPTFTLVEPYDDLDIPVYHFDLYRLQSSNELEEMGFRDYLSNTAICIIEWPEKANDYLPKPQHDIHLSLHQQGRKLIYTSHLNLD